MIYKRILRIYIVFLAVLLSLHLVRFVPVLALNIANGVSYCVGVALILALLVKEKPFMPKGRLFPLFCILGAFFVFYAVTLLVNGRVASNLTVFASTGIQMFLVLYYLAGSGDEAEAAMGLVMKTLLAAGTLFALANIALLLAYMDIGKIFKNTGRFQGIFYNPNDAFVCALALACSLWMLRFGKGRKWLPAACAAVLAAAVFISGSRASIIMVAVTAVLFVFFRIRESGRGGRLKAVLLPVLVAAACVALFLASRQLIEYKWQSGLAGQNGTTVAEVDEATKDSRYSESVSNSLRFYLIQSGLNTFARHPVFGVTSRGLPEAVIETNRMDDETAYVSGVNSGLHNAYLQALVSNGLAGFIPLLCLLAYCAVTFAKGWRAEVKYAVAVLLGLCVYGLFESTLIFSNSPSSLLLWSMTGYAINRALGPGMPRPAAQARAAAPEAPAAGG